MLGEAIHHLRSLPRDSLQRANVFETLAGQIQAASGGAWQASRGLGIDGAHVFLGRQGEGLVVAPDGRIYRGAIGHGINVTPAGLQPDYTALRALD
jgi:hypothetical protein